MLGLMWEHLGAAVAALALLSNVVAAVIGLALRNAMLKVENRLAAKIAAAKTEIDSRIDQHVQELEEKLDRQSREFGETVTAIRTKIHDVEVWARDNFVRRDTFQQVAQEFSRSVRDLGTELKERLTQMEDKIDGKGRRPT